MNIFRFLKFHNTKILKKKLKDSSKYQIVENMYLDNVSEGRILDILLRTNIIFSWTRDEIIKILHKIKGY